MLRIFRLSLPLAALMVASCQEPTSPSDKPSVSRESPTTPAPTDAIDDTPERSDGITMRYTCEQGHSVAIVRGDTARVSLADGRVIDIPRIADSSPPRYSGVALSFDVGSNGATLGQHEVGGFACRESD